jgi:multidrug resistance efflux pump
LLIAKRAEAVQQVAQLEAELAAAKAEDARLVAEESYARTVHGQEQAIYKQDATTDRKYVEAVQKYKAAQAALERSRAQVRRAEQALAARVGAEHALVAQVEAQLAEARLNLEWTRVYAPCDGRVTDLQLREGAYTHTGRAAMTLIDTSQWLVVANFRENALTRVREGQTAGVAFRGSPGRVFEARVVSVGWGVSQGQGVPSGQLPDMKVPGSWVPPAQRFQVRLTLDDAGAVPLRVGMTGSVAIYTDPEGALNPVTRAWHEVIAWLYHL